MLRITTLTPKQLFKDGGFDLEHGMPHFSIFMDCEPGTVAKVLSREGVFETQKGHRIKIPMKLTDLMDIDDSETTGSEMKEIFICKVPEGYLIGVYLY